MAQSPINTAVKLNITPEALIEKLDESQSNGTFFTLQIAPAEKSKEPEQLSLRNIEDGLSEKTLPKDKSYAKRYPLGQIPTDSSISEINDPSNLLINNMNTQQQALNNLTTAIYDLIEVIQSDRAAITTPVRQSPRQESDSIPQPNCPLSQPEPSSQQNSQATQDPKS